MASSNAIYDLLGKHARPKSKHSPHENQNHNVGIQRYDPFLATVSQKSGNHNVGTRFKIEYNILFLAASNVTISTFVPRLPRKLGPEAHQILRLPRKEQLGAYQILRLGAFLVAPDFSPSFMFETLRQRVSLGIACLAKPHCFMSPWSLKSVRLSFCRNGWIELKGPMPLSRFGLRQVLITTHVCLQ